MKEYSRIPRTVHFLKKINKPPFSAKQWQLENITKPDVRRRNKSIAVSYTQRNKVLVTVYI